MYGPTAKRGQPVNGAWFHGMVTPVADNSISCGFVARHVSAIHDVCYTSNTVLQPLHENTIAKHDKQEVCQGMYGICGRLLGLQCSSSRLVRLWQQLSSSGKRG